MVSGMGRTRATCTIVTLAVVLASGCGADTTAEPSSKRPVIGAARAMQVLTQPRTAADVIPSSFAPALSAFLTSDSVDEALRPGALESSRSHRLLADLGAAHASLYALPTNKGRVCFIFADPEPKFGGCVSSFGGDVAIPRVVGDGQPREVFGLVPDSVTSVGVVDEGAEHDAVVQNNAYYYQLGSPLSYPEAIVVTYADGTTTREKIPPPPQHG
jgi:hypothetical protein